MSSTVHQNANMISSISLANGIMKTSIFLFIFLFSEFFAVTSRMFLIRKTTANKWKSFLLPQSERQPNHGSRLRRTFEIPKWHGWGTVLLCMGQRGGPR